MVSNFVRCRSPATFSGATIAISKLTIANGLSDQGGGIDNSGALALTQTRLANNEAVSDANAPGWGGAIINEQGATPNIPPNSNRRWKPCFSKRLYRERNLIKRFFSKLKHFRRVATRYDNLAPNYLAIVSASVATRY